MYSQNEIDQHVNARIERIAATVTELKTQKSLVAWIASVCASSVLMLGGYLVYSSVRSEAQIEDVRAVMQTIDGRMVRLENYLMGERRNGS